MQEERLENAAEEETGRLQVGRNNARRSDPDQAPGVTTLHSGAKVRDSTREDGCMLSQSQFGCDRTNDCVMTRHRATDGNWIEQITGGDIELFVRARNRLGTADERGYGVAHFESLPDQLPAKSTGSAY